MLVLSMAVLGVRCQIMVGLEVKLWLWLVVLTHCIRAGIVHALAWGWIMVAVRLKASFCIRIGAVHTVA